MSTLIAEPQTTSALTLNIESVGLSDEQFEQLCRDNRDLRIEMTAKGELIIMPPTGGKTGIRNTFITQQLANWTETDGSGVCFDSSTLFILPNGAKRSPDAAWVSRAQWDALTPEEQTTFPPLCPDFVIELRSPTDSLKTLQAKMEEYIENGARLGWLIDADAKIVFVYRPQEKVERLDDAETLAGDPLLPGFRLDMKRLWPKTETQN